MRYALPMGLAGALAAVSLLTFWRVHALSRRDISALTGGVASMAADWEARKVPLSRRVVNLVIADAESEDPYEAVLPQGGLVETASGWVSRSLIGGDAALANPTPFARAVADSTSLVWCHEGFSTVSRERMAREIAEAVLKANEAGAEVNIVAQGVSAGPALLALISLEATERGGVKVGANKVVLVGLSSSELERLSATAGRGFSKPGNVLEVAAIWAPREDTAKTPMIQLLGAGGKGETETLASVWPEFGSGGQDLGKLINGLVARVESLEKIVGLQKQALREAEAKKAADEAALREAQAREAQAEADRRAAEARLAAEEAARKEAEARKGALEAQRRRAQAAAVQWIVIPGGKFAMGSDRGASDEQPRRWVTVRTFQMAKTEVTNGQYRACVEAGACSPAGGDDARFNGDDRPVVYVDWNQASAFSRWVGGRLPSEAEWEYAARSGGREQEYPWGNETASCARAVISGCGNATAPVCSKPAGNTAHGLCDMAGNAWEWVQDWYHGSYNGAPSDGSAWESPAGSNRVDRGGAWYSGASNARAAFRNLNDPALRSDYLSFRPVR